MYQIYGTGRINCASYQLKTNGRLVWTVGNSVFCERLWKFSYYKVRSYIGVNYWESFVVIVIVMCLFILFCLLEYNTLHFYIKFLIHYWKNFYIIPNCIIFVNVEMMLVVYRIIRFHFIQLLKSTCGVYCVPTCVQFTIFTHYLLHIQHLLC